MSKKYTLSRKKADRHLLYQWSVQDAETEIEFAVKRYTQRRGRPPMTLREDFCGTASVACNWVRGHPERTAVGLDLDQPTLDWAETHNVKPLGPDAKRVTLLNKDVRSVTKAKFDLIFAANFSYFIFHPLNELVKYFDCVRRSLAPGGIFILDCYGGWESGRTLKERRVIKSPKGTFGYIWDQADFDPITNQTTCHIHFEFKNGKRWKEAFTYEWRLYTPAEVKDALLLAGFSDAQVYWDIDEDEDASNYQAVDRAFNTPGWIA